MMLVLVSPNLRRDLTFEEAVSIPENYTVIEMMKCCPVCFSERRALWNFCKSEIDATQTGRAARSIG
jgi:hypothetical protein